LWAPMMANAPTPEANAEGLNLSSEGAMGRLAGLGGQGVSGEQVCVVKPTVVAY
jgi:hypothetical protein